MDLRKRLARLDRMTRRPVVADEATQDLDPKEQIRQLEDLGLRRDEASGRFWLRERNDNVSAPTGLPTFDGLFTRAAEADPQVSDLLFLDVETTGLAGGTGTLAFLIGTSWWEGQSLVTRQYFLASPGQESAVLDDLERLAARFSVIVTFNGASFDLPLLRTRALMNRREDPLSHLVSWDLLVPSRRLWGKGLENCRQQTLELEVCGLEERTGDIDGSEIPAVWFEFLAGGGTERLDRVLHHNHLDMVGMAYVFGRVTAEAIELEANRVASDSGRDWLRRWSLGKICEIRRDQERSIVQMRAAVAGLESLGDERQDPRFLADAIRILKRSGDWLLVESVVAWGLTWSAVPEWLHREAAILYERRLGDLQKALAHALKCGENSRIERLQRKLAARDSEVQR